MYWVLKTYEDGRKLTRRDFKSPISVEIYAHSAAKQCKLVEVFKGNKLVDSIEGSK